MRFAAAAALTATESKMTSSRFDTRFVVSDDAQEVLAENSAAAPSTMTAPEEIPVNMESIDGPLEAGFVGADSPKDVRRQSTFKNMKAVEKVTVEWQDVSYVVKIRNTKQSPEAAADVEQGNTLEAVERLKSPKKNDKFVEKVVLDQLHGHASPGELLVIMGPSGSGKTSLLNCLAGRNSSYTGKVMLNGHCWQKRFKYITSYVQQHDLFISTLTVREHLHYQAKLRMDEESTDKEREEMVNNVLAELGLEKAQHTRIGETGVLRGISGGERKRLAFATEALTNPSVMLADEPTSGLDSFMAESVVEQLQDLARTGRTIVATIHQASSDVFGLFDKIYLIAEGRTIYHGDATSAIKYFASLRYQCPSFTNPADYFMKQMSIIPYQVEESRKRVNHLANAYENSQEAAEKLSSGVSVASTSRLYLPNHKKAPLWKQCKVLGERGMKHVFRSPITFRARIGQTVFLGTLVGLLYFQVDNNQQGVQDFNGAMFFIVVNQTMSSAFPIVQTFPLELPLFIREHDSGMYSTLAYYVSKTFSETPFQILWPILMSTIAYWMVGFSDSFADFLIFSGVVALVANCAVSLGYMISCISPTVDLAMLIAPLIILPLMLFGGFFINSDSIPVYFEWLSYLSFIRYGFHALAINLWEDYGPIRCDEPNPSDCAYRNGEQVLDLLNINPDQFGLDIVMLFVLLIAFRLIAFGFLVRRVAVAKRDN